MSKVYIMTLKVLITDYAWPSLDIERAILQAVDAEVVAAHSGEESELVQLAASCDAILTNWKKVTPAVLDAAPHCLIVSRYGIGVDNIAVEHATRLGILVANVPDFCLDEASDHTMALLLAWNRQIVTYATATRRGVWQVSAGRPIRRLYGQTLGIIGYGNIAQTLVPKALSFGLKVIVYTPRLSAEDVTAFGANCVVTNDLDELLSLSDYVSIHVPLTDETRGMIDARALHMLKPTAYLINTSRGAVIDETALYQALREGWFAGAALDVLVQEPPRQDYPLLSLPNVIVTPHAAFYSEDAVADVQQKAAEHVACALRKETPTNVLNAQVLRFSNYRLKA
jgi:D-3-phosphoglycerate dehydrogenase